MSERSSRPGVTRTTVCTIALIIAISVLAFIQILVHLVFFLHMNTSSSQRWNVVAFGFTVMVAVIVIGGTLWVLHNVGAHMMSR